MPDFADQTMDSDERTPPLTNKRKQQELGLHTYNSSIMSNSNFCVVQSTFDTAFSNELCSEQLNSPYLVNACTSQLDELPWASSDTSFDQAVACYDLPKELSRRSSEVSTTAFALF